jgi:hypothetical protein
VIVIADNDVLKKLACCDLYKEFSEAFEVSFREIYILNTAKHVLRSKRIRKQLDEGSFQRLSVFLDAVQVITAAPDPDEQVALTEEQGIDAGEAVLFSVTHPIKNALLATGDKRSLGSLAKSVDKVCRRLCKKLAGKVVCFEQILLKILDGEGFDSVRDNLVLGRECDKVLAVILGSGLDASEATIREGLTSYIEDLRRQTGSLLLDP